MPIFVPETQVKHEARAEKVSCLVWLLVMLATYTVFILGFRHTITQDLVINISLLVAIIAPGFSILFLLIHKGIYFAFLKYVNIFLQVTLVSGAIVFDSMAQGPAYALSSMPPMAYALVPMITAFRLQPALGLFAGTISAIQFMALYMFLLKPDPQLIIQIPSLGFEVTLMKAFVLFSLGVASALAASSLKNYFINYGKSQEMQFRLKNNFGRFVSPEIVNQIENSRNGIIPASEQDVAIVFGDIRGFTTFAATQRTALVTEVLNSFFAIVCRAVEAEGGMVNKFLGDGYLAFFGLYGNGDKPCEAAARAVLRIEKEAMAVLSEYNLQTGAAASYGRIITGEVGSEGRCEFTAIGAPVNLAARLESMNSAMGTSFLVSQDFMAHLNNEQYNILYLGEHPVKGLEENVAVFEVSR